MIEILHYTRNWKFATITYAFLFAISIFFQCISFNYLAFRSLPIECIIIAPKVFWGFFLPKISISLFFAAFVFLFKQKNWTIIFSTVISLWCLADLIYYRINGILLDEYSFTMIGNMKGFWASIIAFVFPLDLVLLCPVILVCFAHIFFASKYCSKIIVSVLIILSMGLQCIGTYNIYLESRKPEWFNPNRRSQKTYNPLNKTYLGFDSITHAKFTSVLHCLISDLWYLSKMPLGLENNTETEIVDAAEADMFFCESLDTSKPSSNLIIILFESLEYWCINKDCTPNLHNFIRTNENVFYAKKIASQIREGISGDGQMIVNSGILPISEGATCFLFPTIIYPSLSELYSNTIMILPGDTGVWNQAMMCRAYHINNMFSVPNSDDWSSFQLLNEHYSKSSYILLLTMASHAPFKRYSEKVNMTLLPDMPTTMQNYLRSVHYTDSCLAEFLSKVEIDDVLKNSTIVITGDHKIFDSDTRDLFWKYSSTHNEYLSVQEPYCPLIIYSPNIKKKTIIDEVAYQMDIFPTVLHLIGCDSTYYWRGFGKNLMNTEECRKISPEDAFILSDKMIRANYWDTYKKEHNIH